MIKLDYNHLKVIDGIMALGSSPDTLIIPPKTWAKVKPILLVFKLGKVALS